MHRALQIAALHDLPLTTRRVALAAANGSLDHLKTLRSIAGRSTKTSVLPVVYILLDPARIPTPEAFEAMLERNTSDHDIVAAILAWDLFLKSPNFPSAAVPDLWPRLWAWFEFLDTYRDSLSSLLVALPEASHSLTVGFVASANALVLYRLEQGVDLLKKTAGFYTALGRAWSLLLTGGKHGLDSVLDIVTASDFELEMLEPLSEGAGSFEALASLVTGHIRQILDNSDHDPVRWLWAVRVLEACVFPIETVVDEDTGVAHIFLSALLRNGVIEAILHTVQALCDHDHEASDVNLEAIFLEGMQMNLKEWKLAAINWCFSLLRGILHCRPAMGRTLEEALDRALELLLRCMAHCASVAETHDHRTFFLRDFLPSITIHHRSLSSMQIAFENLHRSTSTPSFPESPEWNKLRSVVRCHSKSSAMSQVSSTCDNIKCNRMSKDFFKRCTGCKSTHYCSEACQRTDWKEGGHRESCSLDRRLSLISGCGLTFRERLHIRALMKTHYSVCQSTILCQIALSLRRFPDGGYFVVFDYCGGEVTTAVCPLSLIGWEPAAGDHEPYTDPLQDDEDEAFQDDEPEWKDHVARAARSNGRYTIHVLRYSLGIWGENFWYIPLRSTTPTIDAGLRRIAADPAIGNDGFVDAVNALIATAKEDGEFEETH
ncbi:hypothetical protein B0H16DRAFT_1805030 [Mycena metata]|uniref:MYND-type domain-containing protein n=1 Tax=Mycena metata TaxID=1033252 RepID=A0AAD7MFQ5_9AGAR|nr:hypothetical protein B0H16DRAFT_1805030 [Mycena metata]